MSYSFRPMEEASAKKITHWQYPPPFDIYNIDPDKRKEISDRYLDPENRYFLVSDQDGMLVGFFCYGKEAQVPGVYYSADALDLGGELAPELPSQGMGRDFYRQE